MAAFKSECRPACDRNTGRFGVGNRGRFQSESATFDKDQRVSHTAIVENKRLSAALAYVKEMQDSLPAPRVKTNSEKTGYHKTGRKGPGRPGLADKRAACAAE